MSNQYIVVRRPATVTRVIRIAGAAGTIGTPPWSQPVPWAASTAYIVFAPGYPASCVTYLGSTYVCITAHTSGGSFDATKWRVVAESGANSVEILLRPNAITLPATNDVATNSLVESADATISGTSDGLWPIDVTGGIGSQLRINGGLWAVSGLVQPGDIVRLRTTSATSPASTSVTVRMPRRRSVWSVTSRYQALSGSVISVIADPSFCKKDNANTISCGDGDTVQWIDRLALGGSAQQANAANRPVLRRNITANKWYLTGPATFEIANVAELVIPAPATIVARLKLTLPSGSAQLLYGSPASAYYLLQNPGATNTARVTMPNGAYDTPDLTQDVQITVIATRGLNTIRINGVEVASNATASGDWSLQGLSLFSSLGSYQFLGEFYRIALVPVALSGVALTNAETWAMS